MYKILMIEDEENISSFVKMELEYEGYKAVILHDGKEGFEKALNEDFDLIILDLMLPGMSGLEVCRRLRKTKDTPIIMLTARESVMDKVSGLQVGADDYMAKPFAIEELLMRIEVILRRVKKQSKPKDTFRYKKLEINVTSRIVKMNNEEVLLTTKEYELLYLLMKNINKVLSRDELLNEIWGYEYDKSTNVVDVYIRHLRNKLNDEDYIKTVRGVGYVIREE